MIFKIKTKLTYCLGLKTETKKKTLNALDKKIEKSDFKLFPKVTFRLPDQKYLYISSLKGLSSNNGIPCMCIDRIAQHILVPLIPLAYTPVCDLVRVYLHTYMKMHRDIGYCLSQHRSSISKQRRSTSCVVV